MILRSSGRGKFWGCEDYSRTWPAKGTRPASASRVIDVPEFRLVPWVEEESDENAAHFSEFWAERQARYAAIRERDAKWKKFGPQWWKKRGLELDRDGNLI